MIVDVHTHLPTHRDAVPPEDAVQNTTMRPGGNANTNSVADYLEAMVPVDYAIAVAVAPKPGEPEGSLVQAPAGFPAGLNSNDIAAELVRAGRGKVIGFMSVHPLDPDMDREYARCRDELGLKGIKLIPGAHDFDPAGPEAFRLYARLEADGLPVLFHAGTMPAHVQAVLGYTQPLAYDRVASAFPGLKIVLAHLGHPWHTDMLSVVRKHPNVFADVSAQFYRPWSMWNGLRLFHEWGVMEKLLFGSDWPVATPAETIEGLRGITGFAGRYSMPEVPEDELEAIINRDALEVLGIEP